MGRADKKTIVERDARIAQLEQEKRDLEQKIALLEEEKKELNAQLAEAKSEIEKHLENIKSLDDRVAQLVKEVKDLRGKGTYVRTEAVSQDEIERRLTPGEKGRIVSFNEQWKFVVIEFSPAFMKELLGEDTVLPQFEMMVRRPGLQGAAGDFVTRLRLRQLIREQNLVVADILSDWQQVPTELGDVVYL
jgi:seryl-tRNA synthetase